MSSTAVAEGQFDDADETLGSVHPSYPACIQAEVSGKQHTVEKRHSDGEDSYEEPEDDYDDYDYSDDEDETAANFDPRDDDASRSVLVSSSRRVASFQPGDKLVKNMTHRLRVDAYQRTEVGEHQRKADKERYVDASYQNTVLLKAC